MELSERLCRGTPCQPKYLRPEHAPLALHLHVSGSPGHHASELLAASRPIPLGVGAILDRLFSSVTEYLEMHLSSADHRVCNTLSSADVKSLYINSKTGGNQWQQLRGPGVGVGGGVLDGASCS